MNLWTGPQDPRLILLDLGLVHWIVFTVVFSTVSLRDKIHGSPFDVRICKILLGAGHWERVQSFSKIFVHTSPITSPLQEKSLSIQSTHSLLSRVPDFLDELRYTPHCPYQIMYRSNANGNTGVCYKDSNIHRNPHYIRSSRPSISGVDVSMFVILCIVSTHTTDLVFEFVASLHFSYPRSKLHTRPSELETHNLNMMTSRRQVHSALPCNRFFSSTHYWYLVSKWWRDLYPNSDRV